MGMPTAAEMIRVLELKSHPEGGHYRETFRDLRQVEGRPASTAILYLLAHGERSHWHRIDAVEIWHYYAGAALKLLLVDGSKERNFPARRRYRCRRSSSGGRAGARLASGGEPWSMDAHWLYSCTWLFV